MARVVIDTRPIRNLEGIRSWLAACTSACYRRASASRTCRFCPATASFFFLRYIGHPELEQNTAYLDEWAAHLASWLREGIEAYVFCHCPDERSIPGCVASSTSELHSNSAPTAAVDETDSSTMRQGHLF